MTTIRSLILSLLIGVSSLSAGTCDGSLILPMGADYNECLDDNNMIYHPSYDVYDDYSGDTFVAGNYYEFESDGMTYSDVSSQYSGQSGGSGGQTQTTSSNVIALGSELISDLNENITIGGALALIIVVLILGYISIIRLIKRSA